MMKPGTDYSRAFVFSAWLLVFGYFSPYYRGVGGTGAVGVFADKKGSGWYYRVGLGGGYDISATREVGYSSSFAGVAYEIQGGVGRDSWSVSASINDRYRVSGVGVSYSTGVSVFKRSGHGAGVWTKAFHTGNWRN